MLKLALMLVKEMISPPRVERRPEPAEEMDNVAQVEAFHAQGATALIPIYHFNALAVSRMVPLGGRVVDLGTGSGQYLAYLAERRPDITIVGIDLAPTMVEVGNRFLVRRGLANRVRLEVGDMTAFANALKEPVDLVSSVFSLHHLPAAEDLEDCLREIRAVRERAGCGVWIFDHARPRHPDTPRVFPEIFTPNAPPGFNEDSRNSLIASHSFDELRRQLERAGLGPAQGRLSRWMRLYQAHWTEPLQVQSTYEPRKGAALSPQAQRELAGLRRLFPDVPLDHHF